MVWVSPVFGFYFFTARQARAMEKSLVLLVSPREVSTQGTFVPMTIAASSPPQRCVTDLKKTFADSMLGNSSQSGSPATDEPLTFLCSATSL